MTSDQDRLAVEGAEEKKRASSRSDLRLEKGGYNERGTVKLAKEASRRRQRSVCVYACVRWSAIGGLGARSDCRVRGRRSRCRTQDVWRRPKWGAGASGRRGGEEKKVKRRGEEPGSWRYKRDDV